MPHSYQWLPAPKNRIDQAERSSAPFASKIGGGSGIGWDPGSDAGELQYVLTQSRADIDGPNYYWRRVYDECRRFETLNGGGLLTLVSCVRTLLEYNGLQHTQWRRRELHPRFRLRKPFRALPLDGYDERMESGESFGEDGEFRFEPIGELISGVSASTHRELAAVGAPVVILSATRTSPRQLRDWA